MSRATARPGGASLLIALLLVLASGCRIGADDEMVAPSRTVTSSPVPRATLAPTSIPVGSGEVSPSVAVWAQDSTLHVGLKEVNVFPHRIESLVVVQGGVFLVDRGELWFTDLLRVRDTGLRDVTALATNRDVSALVVTRTTSPGASEQRAYDLADGSATAAAEVTPATVADRLGRSTQVAVRSAGSTPRPRSVLPMRSARLGPGGYGVLADAGEPLVAFAAETRVRVPLDGVVGDGFELVRWTSETTFYGFAQRAGSPIAMLSCDLGSGRCRSLGDVVPDEPVVFETGT